MNQKNNICIVGLGYVGLPLAVEFAKKFPVVGFDINQSRIEGLNKGHDHTLEVADEELIGVLRKERFMGNGNQDAGGKEQGAGDKLQVAGGKVQEAGTVNPETWNLEPATGLYLTSHLLDIQDCNIYIVTVPTPIDKHRRPDLTPLIKASGTVGKVLKKGDIVIYESTVYPGATEEDCVPILEKESGLKYNEDFYCGYSPERINPGDKVHTVTTIKKVTSGSTPEVADRVDELYKSIITGGTHKASSIRVAEAAKVIENSQRDINIAFVNELAVIFRKMGIDTHEVLEAAGSKWNFLPFKPGLVGGHCIGVDPYYLTHKAQEIGYNPEIILAGRRLNDDMGFYVANQVIKLMIAKGHRILGSRVLVLGITFKENCPDIRNSKVIDVINEMKSFGCEVDVYDPWADAKEVKEEYGVEMIGTGGLGTGELGTGELGAGNAGSPANKKPSIPGNQYDAIILAVAHDKFRGVDIAGLKNGKAVVYDVKGFLDKGIVDERL